MGFASGPGMPPPGYATPVPSPSPSFGATVSPDDHVSMDVSSITINNVTTREFAFADQTAGTVTVRNGLGVYTLDGIDNPQAVSLEDINADGIPDLIVADSGQGRILVFPGNKDGSFGAEVNEGQGFGVGTDPVGITVAALDPAGPKDLIVANKGSDDVSVLMSQGQGTSWTLAPQILIPDGLAPDALAVGQMPASPVSTAIGRLTDDGMPDLVILNNGTNSVVVYPGMGGGQFDTDHPIVMATGEDPTSMVIGRFDKRPGLDLVTLNSGSNNLSFITGISSGRPSTLTIDSGGIQPDAAFALDVNHDDTMDLVVANGGDGRVALFQPSNIGMQLSGVITRPDVPSPTAIVEGGATADGFDFYAATAGQDAAAILHFDLDSNSGFLSIPTTATDPINPGDDDLVSQLLANGDSPDSLVTVLWSGGGDRESTISDRGPTSSDIIYARTEGQGIDQDTTTPTSSPASTDLTLKPEGKPDDEWSGTDYVTGNDRGLEGARGGLEAITDSDALEWRGDRRFEALAGAQDRSGDADEDAAASAVEAALHSLQSDDRGADYATPAPIRGDAWFPPESSPRPSNSREESPEAPTSDTRSEVVPVVSSVILASRLILKATPPRPPSFRRGGGRPSPFLRARTPYNPGE